MEGTWVQLLECQGGRARVFLVLRECIWGVPTVSLAVTDFEDTGSLGSPPCQVVYSPRSMVLPWVTVLCFLTGNREAELTHTTFSSFLLFHVFLLCLFS